MNESEQLKAFLRWSYASPQVELDRDLSHFIAIPLGPSNAAWIKRCREAQLLSADAQAKKLKISRSAYSQLEKSEELGTISINSLKKMAEALGCELVYAIRPKSKELFSKMLWKKLWAKVQTQPRLKQCRPQMRPATAAAIAKELMADTEFRRKQAWVAKN